MRKDVTGEANASANITSELSITPDQHLVAPEAEKSSEENTEITMQSLFKELAGSRKGLPKIRKRDTKCWLDPLHNMDVGEFDSELVLWMQGRKIITCPCEDTDYLADFIDESDDDDDPARKLVAEYLSWRAARLVFCAEVRKFLAAVDADEAKRQAADDKLLAELSGTRKP